MNPIPSIDSALSSSKSPLSPRSTRFMEKHMPSWLVTIRKEYVSDWQINGVTNVHAKDFETRQVAHRVLKFKDNEHTNCFEELLEEWEDYRDEHSESEMMNMDTPFMEIPDAVPITKMTTDQQPDSDDSLIMDRHIYEMLYNLMLISHHRMKQRKSKLIHCLHGVNQRNSGSLVEDREKRKMEKSRMIQQWLPLNKETMKSEIHYVFDKVVGEHYSECYYGDYSSDFPVFAVSKKNDILKFIGKCCLLSFEMLLAYSSKEVANLSYTMKGKKTENTELSFFPLLFTDRSSSYIEPVVKWHSEVTKREKMMQRKSTLMNVWKSHKANKKFDESKHDRGYSAASAAQSILYYIFPGVIVSRTEEHLEKAVVFSYDAPEVFLRHDLNWIFTHKIKREKRIKHFVRNHSVKEDDDEEDLDTVFSDGVEEVELITQQSICLYSTEILPNHELMSTARLLEQWVSLKKQVAAELVEDICDLMMETLENEDENEDDEEELIALDDNDNDDRKSDDEELDEEYKCTKLAAQLLHSVMLQCREMMRKKISELTSFQDVAVSGLALNGSDQSLPFLNMQSVYDHRGDSKNEYLQLVMDLLDEIAANVLNGDDSETFTKFEFLQKNEEIKERLHGYAARCCQLVFNVLQHNWDIYPLSLAMQKEKYDDNKHIKDELSGGGSAFVDYCMFPGIVMNENGNEMKEQIIEEEIKQRMWVCLSYISNSPMHLESDRAKMNEILRLQWKSNRMLTRSRRPSVEEKRRVQHPEGNSYSNSEAPITGFIAFNSLTTFLHATFLIVSSRGAISMQLSHFARQFRRRSPSALRVYQSQFQHLQSQHRFRFSSNLDGDDTATTNTRKNETMKKIKNVSVLQESIQNNLKSKIPDIDTSSFWTMTAVDDEHRKWIHKYNLSLLQLQWNENHEINESKSSSPSSSDSNIEPHDMFNFNDLRTWIGYLGSAAFDGYQRFRMRSLKQSVMSYEEFMIGAMNSFQSLQAMDVLNQKQISRCFVPRMRDQVREVKHALFDIAEDEEQTHSIRNIMPFAGTLRISGLYGDNGPEQEMNLEYLEMFFTVRYYYSLQGMKAMESKDVIDDAEMVDVKQRYADIEWLGLFQPLNGGGENESKYEKFELCEKGFVIHNVEVNEC